MNAPAEPRKESASCPMDFILRMLMGPWTTYILYNLKTHGPQRFGELKRRVVGISAKMLTERLRTLEGAGLAPAQQGVRGLDALSARARRLVQRRLDRRPVQRHRAVAVAKQGLGHRQPGQRGLR